MQPILLRLKDRKIVQWALAYLTGAWLIEEVADTLGPRWGLTDLGGRVLDLVLLIGFASTLILAWYHGERGRQRVSGPELLMLAALLGLGGIGLRLVTDVPAGTDTVALDAAANAPPGLAVLPLETLSPQPEVQEFVEGLHVGLISALQRSSAGVLRVAGRQAVLPFRDASATSDSIGRALQVDYLLSGAVQRDGDELRISMELLGAESGRQLWGVTIPVETTSRGVFAMQENIVEQVAGALQIGLRWREVSARAEKGTSNPRAFELFMRARTLDIDRASELLTEALRLDPDFVAAHALMARIQADGLQYVDRTAHRDSLALWHAQQALILDGEDPDAQMAMGWYLYRTKQWDEAVRWLDDITGSLQGEFDYLQVRAWSERRLGRLEESLDVGARIMELHPTAGFAAQQAVTLLMLRRFAESIPLFERSGARPDFLAVARWEVDGDPEWLRLAGNGPEARFLAWDEAMYRGAWDEAITLTDGLAEVRQYRSTMWRPTELLAGWSLEAAGRSPEALEAFRDAERVARDRLTVVLDDARVVSTLGLTLAMLGRHEEALAQATRAVQMAPREQDALEGPVHLFQLAAVQVRAGDPSGALETLADLLDRPGVLTPRQVEQDYLMRALRGDPRFVTLMEEHRSRVF